MSAISRSRSSSSKTRSAAASAPCVSAYSALRRLSEVNRNPSETSTTAKLPGSRLPPAMAQPARPNSTAPTTAPRSSITAGESDCARPARRSARSMALTASLKRATSYRSMPKPWTTWAPPTASVMRCDTIAMFSCERVAALRSLRPSRAAG